MYLHLGNEVIIPQQEIVVILNLENLENPEKREEALEKIEKKTILCEEGCEKANARALIITENKAYLSCISPHTLLKRVERKEFIG